jgi:4-hydroxyphenylpyruvate dioxygenase-like putative hemolysin
MQIILKDADIKLALANYIRTMGFDTAGKIVTSTIKAGRQGSGNAAILNIEDDPDAQSFTQEPTSFQDMPTETDSLEKNEPTEVQLELTEEDSVFPE